MKPPPFEYLDPREKPEALEALAHHGEDGKILAGGQSLVPLLNMRLAQPRVLIDINRVQALQYIVDRSLDGRPGIAFGAGTRQREVEDADDVLPRLPLLADAISWIGHPQIRNRGTVGGSVAHADPAAELPVAFTVLDATFHLRSRQRTRSVGWRDFFITHLTTAIEPDELLVEIEVPRVPAGTGWAFAEYARRHGDFALGGAAAMIRLEDGVCREARLGLLAAADTPVRAEAAERALEGAQITAESTAEAARTAVADINPTGDIHGSSEYRTRLIEAMVRRAIEQATERAGR